MAPLDEWPFASWLRAGGVALGVVLAGLVVTLGRSTVTRDRTLVHDAFVRTDFKDSGSVDITRGALREAMQRHPADPYFPRIGALVAWHAHERPFPWVARALERGMHSGMTHLVLARILATRGAREQALLELQLAVTYQLSLAPTAARLIVHLARDFDDILRATPEGIAGEHVLSFVTGNLRRTRYAELRVRCLEEAMERSPASTATRVTLAGDLVAAIGDHGPESFCAGERRPLCQQRVEEIVADLLRLTPETPSALIVKSQLLLADGRAADAERLLGEGCQHYAFAARSQCERHRVAAAAATGSKELLAVASKDLAAAGCGFGAGCGELYRFLGAQAEHARDSGRALTYYQKAVADEPTDAGWRAVARVAAALGEHALAASALAQLTRRDPADTDARAAYEAETGAVMKRTMAR